MSIAAMFRTSVMPCEAPVAAASMKFASCFSICILTVPIVTGFSVSGHMIFVMRNVPGAAMTDAVMRYFSGAPMRTYASMTAPETCAMPPTIIVKSSDVVIVDDVRRDEDRALPSGR